MDEIKERLFELKERIGTFDYDVVVDGDLGKAKDDLRWIYHAMTQLRAALMDANVEV